jgi:cytoskeleton protein RodZ
MKSGVGQALAAARRAQEMSVETVAEKLKLTVRQVEAIEADDFSHLPGPVFVRGFVRNYARLLGLAPETLLASLDVEQKPTETLTAPSEGVKFGTSPMRKWLLVPLLILALFLLLVAGLYAWLSQGEDTLVTSEAVTPSPITQAPSAEPVLPVAPAPTLQPVLPLAPAPAMTPPPAEAPPASQPPAVASAAPQPAVPPAGAAPQPAVAVPSLAAQPVTPPAAPPKSGATLRFRVDDDAWIQVVDGAGQRYSRLVRAGGSETLRGKPPFRLVIGNAAQVKLDYNDHSIDLTPFIGEKVARLTLE